MTNKTTKLPKTLAGSLISSVTMAIVGMLPASALNQPAISPGTGSYIKQQSVTITAPSGTIYFTTDGSQPTNASTPYSGPISITSPTQLNAVAYQSGTYSSVTSAFLDVDPGLGPLLQTGLTLRLTNNFGLLQTAGPSSHMLRWIDLSFSGNSANGYFPSQPTVGSSAGFSVVNFNGSSQYLSLPCGFSNVPYTNIFIVAQPSALTAGATLLDLGNFAAGNDVLMQIDSTGLYGSYTSYLGTATSATSSPNQLASNANMFQLLESSQANGTASFYLNAVLGQTNAGMNVPGNVARTSNFVGQASGGGNYYAGNISDIRVYSSSTTPLTNAQRVAIEAWLLQKYQVLLQTPEAPIISVPSGTLSQPTQVVISTPPGVITYMTNDGSTPTTSSPVYSGSPILINYSQTLKAMAVKNNIQSTVTTTSYMLDSSQFPAPSPIDMTAPTINLQLPTATH